MERRRPSRHSGWLMARAALRRSLPTLGILAAAAASLAAVYISTPESFPTRSLLSDTCLFAAGLLSAIVILQRARKPGAWEGTLPFGVAMLAMAVAKALDFVNDLFEPTVRARQATDLFFLIIGALFLIPAWIQFREHFRKEDRREIAADVALIAVARIGVVYLLLRRVGETQQLASLIWSGIFAATAAAALTAYIALVLWVPTPSHMGRLGVVASSAGGTLSVGAVWIRGTEIWGAPGLDLPVAFGALLLAGLMVVRPANDPGVRHIASGGWGRPVLTAVSVVAASVSLAVVAEMEARGIATLLEGSILIVLLAAAVAARILVNQVRGRQANDQTRRALEEKEAALHEADLAMARLREALDTLTASEERLRLLFDAAVDGIVELDGDDIIRRAN